MTKNTTLSPVPSPPLTRAAITGREVLVAIGLILVFAGIAGIGTWSIAHAISPAWATSVDFVVLVVAEVYAAVIGALLLVVGGRQGLRDRLGFHFTSWRDIRQAMSVDVICALALLPTYLVFTPLFGSPLTTAIPVLKAVTDVTRLPGADAFTLLMIGIRVLILVPIAEELLFRGLLYGWLRRTLPALPTILITTVVFAIEHIDTQIALPRLFFLVPLAFVFGIGVGWVRERTGSTLNTAVMHVVVDVSLLIIASLLILPR